MEGEAGWAGAGWAGAWGGQAYLVAAGAMELPLGRLLLTERLPWGYMSTMAQIFETGIARVCLLIEGEVV